MSDPINAFAPPPKNALLRVWGMVSDPFTLNTELIKQGKIEYGKGPVTGSRSDAFRHILGTALLAKKHGVPYAEFITNLHENPFVPFVGGVAQSKEDREMDLYNNRLGLEIADKSNTYEDLINTVKQYIESGKAKTLR